MIITINKQHGKIQVNATEIELLIKEQLKMVPGIISTGETGLLDRMRMFTRPNGYKPVRVYPISKQTVGVACHVKMFEGANFKLVAEEAQSIIKFSIEKKYELEVDHIDIVIDGLIER